MKSGIAVALDLNQKVEDIEQLANDLRQRVVGQDEAIDKVCESHQKFLSGFCAPNRPISNFLLLGPTGCGKTRLVEALAEALFDTPDAVLKIDCGEYQASHDIAKIIGAPPGYVGHNEKGSNPAISQEKLDRYHTKELRLSLILFDEIEKANETLWNLLLGILDKGVLTLGNGSTINFSKCMVFLTSNLGAREMTKLMDGSLGFGHKDAITTVKQLDRAALQAARKQFSPEFINRIDHTVVFQSLSEDHLMQILKIELTQLQKRIITSESHQKFSFICTDSAHKWLLLHGTDKKYGARHLKRTIEKHLVLPLSGFVMTGQLELGDCLLIGTDSAGLQFKKIPAKTITELPHSEWSDFDTAFI